MSTYYISNGSTINNRISMKMIFSIIWNKIKNWCGFKAPVFVVKNNSKNVNFLCNWFYNKLPELIENNLLNETFVSYNIKPNLSFVIFHIYSYEKSSSIIIDMDIQTLEEIKYIINDFLIKCHEKK